MSLIETTKIWANGAFVQHDLPLAQRANMRRDRERRRERKEKEKKERQDEMAERQVKREEREAKWLEENPDYG